MATATAVLSPYFVYNGVDLSAQTLEIRLPFGPEELEAHASGDGTKVKFPGLETWELTAVLRQKWGAGGVDATLWAAKEAEKPPSGTSSAWSMRRKNAAQAADNPTYSSNGYIKSYNIVAGPVGTEEIVEVTIMAAGNLARAAT